MRKKLLLTLLISTWIFNVELKAQTYFSFPDSNAVWKIDFGGYQCSCCATYHYSFDGDTLINFMTYHKIRVQGVTYYENGVGLCTNIISGTFNYYSFAMRSDTTLKKVFMIPHDSITEWLLYDFNLMVGDSVSGWMKQNTFSPSDTISVSAIDSILIANQYRKRWSFVINTTGIIQNQIIDGIGNIGGLIEPLFTFEFGGVLSCFQQNGQTIYPDTNTVCLFTGINEINTQSESINVYPNPADKIIAVTVRQKENIIITNLLGVIMIEKKVVSNRIEKVELDISFLSAGIYFVKAGNKVMKFVKQ